jgi:hypothetical protein
MKDKKDSQEPGMIRQLFTASRKSFCKTTLRLSSINARLCDDNINSNHILETFFPEYGGVPPQPNGCIYLKTSF